MRAFIALLLLSSVAFADKEHHNSDLDLDANITTDAVVTNTTNLSPNTDVSVNSPNKSKALALGNVLGDVDIADCLGSTQWNTPVFGKQKLVLNNVCMAEFYLKMRKYKLAAMALCNVPEILKEFDSDEECEGAHDFGPIEVVYSEPVVTQSYLEQQLQMQEDEVQRLQFRLSEIEQLQQKIEKRPAPKQRIIEKTIEVEPWLTDEKRKKLADIRGDEDE